MTIIPDVEGQIPPNQADQPEARLSPLSSQAAGKARVDSPLATFMGLIVLWLSLLVIFTAHRLSDSFIRLETPEVKNLNQDQSFLRALEPREELLLPFKMHLRETSARQALVNIAASVGFNIQEENLKKRLSDEPRTIRFNNMPLYKAIHELLHDSNLGFALQERNLFFFKQTLETSGTPEHKYTLDWKAQMELTGNRLLVFPSGSSDLYFTIHLIRDVNSPDHQWRTVQVEVWRGTECLTTAKSMLDEKGNAQLSMSTAENIAVSITRLDTPAADSKPGRYGLQFYYQSFE
jgi:hypothetical protein